MCNLVLHGFAMFSHHGFSASEAEERPKGGSAVDPALQQKGEGMDHTTGAGTWQGDLGMQQKGIHGIKGISDTNAHSMLIVI